MDKNELRYHLQKCEKLNQRNKRKRCCRTVLFYTVVMLIMLYWLGELGDNLAEMLVSAIFCFILSFPTYFINLEIFSRELEQDKHEEEALEFLRKRLREKEKEDN